MMDHIAKLKNVKQIVLQIDDDAEVISRWQHRFPKVTVLTLTEWRRLTNY